MMEPGLILVCLTLVVPATVGDTPLHHKLSPSSAVSPDANHPFMISYTLGRVDMRAGGTGDVELRCVRDGNVSSRVQELVWMAIWKQTGQGWAVLADQRGAMSDMEGQGGLSCSGRLSPVEDAYLSVAWTNPTHAVYGSYKCLALGRDEQASFVVDETAVVEIKPENITENVLLGLILDTEETFEKGISDNSREIADTRSALEDFSQQLERNFSAVNDRLDQAHITVDSIMEDFLFPPAEEVWPEGTYGLLRPESGCPEDLAFYGGDTGYFRLHSESSSTQNNDAHSKGSHLSKPILTSYSINSFVNLRFCVTNGVYNSGAWPNGRYCIHAKGNCPAGFNSGYVTIKTESWGNLDGSGGNIPGGSPARMNFCCRSSGDTNIPMVLPTRKPFYLYQYDGRCQRVKGMKVTEEYVQIGTEPGSTSSGVHPYLSSESAGDVVRLEICYYRKR